MAIKVLFSGPLSTIQDGGRFGFMKAGVTTSGAMDLQAYNAANELVGNTAGEAVIESTLMGPTLEFEEETVIAMTGADMDPRVDGKEIPLYQPVWIKKGQVLSMQMAKNGCRSYLAVHGGIDVPIVMNSRSTNLKCHIGGLEGRALWNGDLIPIHPFQGSEEEKSLILAKKMTPLHYDTNVTVRVILGPQDSYFTDAGKLTFFHSTYAVSTDSDRMGFRLEGPEIESKNGVDIVSDGIAFGAIQVPPSGKPIVLLADRQTTGGYAKIGTLYSEDIPKFVQLKPGDTVRFQKISVEEAQSQKGSIGNKKHRK